MIREIITDYFFNKRFDERLIPKVHFDIIHAIDDELSIRLEPLLDRNYSHSTDFILLLNPTTGWINGTYEFMGNEELTVLKNTPGHVHWSLLFKLSLAGNFATCIFNSRQLIDNEIHVEQIRKNNIPADLQKWIVSIVQLVEAYNYQFPDPEELEKRQNWINTVFEFQDDYEPMLYDMLFGSFELYTKADI